MALAGLFGDWGGEEGNTCVYLGMLRVAAAGRTRGDSCFQEAFSELFPFSH